ncbi:PP2C family protein-serine/threonine phosphatase [Polaribacter glomeratus]|nr:PP2C family serine/threonine-protein phosphatase [Polaribacter glomeratus]TXD66210.1 serine/threonine-protein phosphatase [Polaribacter glomeratus]
MNYRSYSHIGKKKVNEDYVINSENSFIVCDGVGGEVRGEIASKEIATFILKRLEKIDGNLSKEKVYEAIITAQKNLNTYIQEKEDLAGMATTLAAVFISDKGLYTSHIGDSRVYLVRPSNHTFWHTWDHSLVGNLVKNGEISREAGRKHPMNNQIFKAIKANFKDKVTEPEINYITDIRKDDIIFICSDGISEAFSDVELLEVLADSANGIDEKIAMIAKKCAEDSIDNNTAILCQIEKEDVPKTTLIPLEWKTIASLHENDSLDTVSLEDTTEEEEEEPKKKKWFRF